MKTIVVSGARSNVGKTTLARKLAALFSDSIFIKIGHHPINRSKHDTYFQSGTPFKKLQTMYNQYHYLIIESNSILKEITPDCTIYLPADSPKPSALLAEKKADIIRGSTINVSTIDTLAERLEIKPDLMRQVISLSGAQPENC